MAAADAHRFLGFAFAAADLLFEVEPHGQVVFMLGAGRGAGTSEEDLIGRSCTTLFELDDAPVIEAALEGLERGARKGPIAVRLANAQPPHAQGALAALSLCRLPQLNDRISCALSINPAGVTAAAARTGSGLGDLNSLESLAGPILDIARAAGQELDLALIELCGLEALLSERPEAEADALRRRVTGAIRAESFAGSAAAALGEDRFAVLRQSGEKAEVMERRLARVLASAAGDRLRSQAELKRLDPAAPGAQAMSLIRHAAEEFLAQSSAAAPAKPGRAAAPKATLGQSVQATLARAGAFRAMVADRRFELTYQPVVDLKTRTPRHYEVLVRFQAGQSPFAMIRLAEELDMIETLDLAVAEQAIRALQADPSGRLILAVNVSGRSIVSASYARKVLGLAGSALKGRLMFEVTESAVIEDLEAAAANIEALRARGFEVCLDDFGAGAASFDYLRKLGVDVVKLDGRYVREMGASERGDALVRHIVDLCRELKVRTVAEMIETETTEAALRAAGIDEGQGWLYGQPGPLPEHFRRGAPIARRAGARDHWS
ncbi:MAG: EAL domain-containing protein [Proteobacteria bacterium]|nr:EAL domain-containing protein [Pseudomonadota bacterium]